jgi:hypothetical protein
MASTTGARRATDSAPDGFAPNLYVRTAGAFRRATLIAGRRLSMLK